MKTLEEAVDQLQKHIKGMSGDQLVDLMVPLLMKGLTNFDPVADVEAFHRKMGIAYDGKPRMLPFEELQFRLKFLREELQEYETHSDKAHFELDPNLLGPRDDANLTFHLSQSLDSLVDLVYVAVGTAHLHGFNFREAWDRVHAANMLKQRAQQEGDAEGRRKLKVIKPEGWEPPKLDDLVEDHAHRKTI